jgi:hypothetical protein
MTYHSMFLHGDPSTRKPGLSAIRCICCGRIRTLASSTARARSRRFSATWTNVECGLSRSKGRAENHRERGGTASYCSRSYHPRKRTPSQQIPTFHAAAALPSPSQAGTRPARKFLRVSSVPADGRPRANLLPAESCSQARRGVKFKEQTQNSAGVGNHNSRCFARFLAADRLHVIPVLDSPFSNLK